MPAALAPSVAPTLGAATDAPSATPTLTA